MELTDSTLHRLKDTPTVIVFTENTREDVHFCQKLLAAAHELLAASTTGGAPAAGEDKTNGNNEHEFHDALQYMYTGG
jgi:hypothetical protein